MRWECDHLRDARRRRLEGAQVCADAAVDGWCLRAADHRRLLTDNKMTRPFSEHAFSNVFLPLATGGVGNLFKANKLRITGIHQLSAEDPVNQEAYTLQH